MKPIPMILHCPVCFLQHIDTDEWETKPHKTHRCVVKGGCRSEWRPADVTTVGVDKLNSQKEVELQDLIERCRKLPPPTEEQRNEWAASFAFGNLALMKEYNDASPEKLENLRQMCRKLAGCKE